MSGGELQEIVGEFIAESRENLERFDDDLLTLERDPGNAGAIDSVFRTVHTIKGTCGFFGFQRLEALSHAAESLLNQLRREEVGISAAVADGLLATGDVLRAMLVRIERTGEEGDGDQSELLATLEALRVGLEEQHPAPQTTPSSGGGSEPDTRLGALLVDRGAADPEDVASALHEQQRGDRRPLGELLVERGAVDVTEVEGALAQQASARAAADQSVRIGVDLLDELMDLVTELVLARNRITQLAQRDSDGAFAAAAQRLDTLTTQLQARAMKTRMQPISSVWSRLPRLVRDLSAACGKQVLLELEGQSTELDRNVLEAIRDPLTHLVRNAIDHGIEDPATRAAAGKDVEARVTLRAHHEGGQIVLEVRDDGAGIDDQRLRTRAVERGLVDAAAARRMSRRDALELIFTPGLSTVDEVSTVSGRGVGMDVVRTNLERIGGSVDVASDPGAGTTFELKIPLTLAIVPALIVSSGGDRYAVPQLHLVELLRLEGARARDAIEWVHDTPVHRLRGRLLPLVHLEERLGRSAPARERDHVTIVVLQADGHQLGLVVDDVTDTEEIVVKPLGAHLEHVPVFAGATVMGDGSVSLILDVLGIAHEAGIATGAGSGAEAPAIVSEPARRSLLLARVGDDRRVAIDLTDVDRLESFGPDRIEWAEGREVVQHRGGIVPLLRLAGDATAGTESDATSIEVVVVFQHGRHVGLVVDEVLDILDQEIATEPGDQAGTEPDGDRTVATETSPARDHGSEADGPLSAGGVHPVASSVVHGRVTDVLDVRALLASVEAGAAPRGQGVGP